MLCLSRKCGETIVLSLGDLEVRCKVVEVIGNKVKLGWEADPSVRIDREEIFNQRLEQAQ